MEQCPNCGSQMEKASGNYYFCVPFDPEKGEKEPIVVPDSEWIECRNCGQVMLPAKLDSEIERLWEERKKEQSNGL